MGAASGMGLASVTLFLEQGARVVACDLQALEPAHEAVEAVLAAGCSATAGKTFDDVALLQQCDVTDETSVSAMCRAALAHFGQVDAAVMAAGICLPPVSWLECDAAHLLKQNAVNVLGPWLVTKHAVRAMRDSPHGGKGGALVFVASTAAIAGPVRPIALLCSLEGGSHSLECSLDCRATPRASYSDRDPLGVALGVPASSWRRPAWPVQQRE